MHWNERIVTESQICKRDAELLEIYNDSLCLTMMFKERKIN